MNWPKLDKWNMSPESYRKLGMVYVWKPLLWGGVAALSLAVLGILGPPRLSWFGREAGIPVYAYHDPALKTITGRVQITDAQGQVRYVGDVDQGAYTGQGKVYDRTGQLCYEGPLENGVYQGTNAKVYKDGVLVYQGEMADNCYEGQGRRMDPDTGLVSQGNFVKGQLEGPGQEYDSSGRLVREGTFSADRLNGPGKEYDSSGALVREGNFCQGLLHGEGKVYTSQGTPLYEGSFSQGVYQGKGKLYHPDTGSLLYQGDFVQGEATGMGEIYHSSGQLLYEGSVFQGSPRADSFLGLSLEELEESFTQHWQLYTWEGVTAFVYPYFQVMFVTQSPVHLVSSQGQAGEEEQSAADLVLDPETDKSALILTEVLSWGKILPGIPQPQEEGTAVLRPAGWQEWFAAYAAGNQPEGARVTQAGPLVFRFATDSGKKAPWVERYPAQNATLNTVTVWREDKGHSLWYQMAEGRESP